jgi:hypothetical protein
VTDEEQDQGAKERGHDVAARGFRVEAKTRRQDAGHAGAQHADDDVADQAEAIALDQQTCQPTGNGADDDPG